MFLIFDTETTTFPQKGIAPTDPNQARIVQLAWLLLDEQFEEKGCFNCLINIPEHVNISEGAAAAHGITKEICNKFGVDIRLAVSSFEQATRCASLYVAHNIPFDKQMLQIEGTILNRGWKEMPEICTMRAMTPLCKLPFPVTKRYNNGQQYKWPKLQEAYSWIFHKEFEGAHDALADVRAAAQVFKWLVENKHICLTTPIQTTSIV